MEFIVSDTGIGIKSEDLERIFNRFEQVDRSSNRRYPGAAWGSRSARTSWNCTAEKSGWRARGKERAPLSILSFPRSSLAVFALPLQETRLPLRLRQARRHVLPVTKALPPLSRPSAPVFHPIRHPFPGVPHLLAYGPAFRFKTAHEQPELPGNDSSGPCDTIHAAKRSGPNPAPGRAVCN